jgi:glutathione peroxidase-family protein
MNPLQLNSTLKGDALNRLFQRMHGQSFYKYLKKKCPGPLGVEAIPWSYTKFLVNRQGIPVGRYFFMKGPNSME